jgi:hypothetical protein
MLKWGKRGYKHDTMDTPASIFKDFFNEDGE